MTVRFTVNHAGHRAGDTAQVPQAQAARLIDARVAVPVKAAPSMCRAVEAQDHETPEG